MALLVCRSGSELAVRPRPTKMAKRRSSLCACIVVDFVCVGYWTGLDWIGLNRWMTPFPRKSEGRSCRGQKNGRYAHLRIHDGGAEEHARGDGRLQLRFVAVCVCFFVSTGTCVCERRQRSDLGKGGGETRRPHPQTPPDPHTNTQTRHPQNNQSKNKNEPKKKNDRSIHTLTEN